MKSALNSLTFLARAVGFFGILIVTVPAVADNTYQFSFSGTVYNAGGAILPSQWPDGAVSGYLNFTVPTNSNVGPPRLSGPNNQSNAIIVNGNSTSVEIDNGQSTFLGQGEFYLSFGSAPPNGILQSAGFSFSSQITDAYISGDNGIGSRLPPRTRCVPSCPHRLRRRPAFPHRSAGDPAKW